MGKQRVHLFITGKVQGVFFRQAMKVTAIKNNATGWVRNLKDGRVEAVIEGEDLDVSNVVEWSHAGPANARVEDVEIRNEQHKGEFAKFEVLY
ncbi:MAG TPA: acylphosphatase [Candidatus Nitrosotenuis sp.]|jgi:acylphosphatase|nr:acylphosphatase [Candidatus Nitrosotenuis sp.]HIH68228.1 acylphosphatase [Candidatus Nitrosotenuis sp.]HII03462.1 acylphosphatase [Candidatus Nitrosotenuis sp.]